MPNRGSESSIPRNVLLRARATSISLNLRCADILIFPVPNLYHFPKFRRCKYVAVGIRVPHIFITHPRAVRNSCRREVAALSSAIRRNASTALCIIHRFFDNNEVVMDSATRSFQYFASPAHRRSLK